MADVKTLPDEVLNLICEDLGQQRDFSTLFKCAQSCASLADPALRTMYRYITPGRRNNIGFDRFRLHEQSPAFNQSDEIEAQRQRRPVDYETKVAERDLLFRKWLCLWRSIILSSLDKTYQPYCHYLRILDFRNLSQLFEDFKFPAASRSFFAGGLEIFHFTKEDIYGRHAKSPSKKRMFQSTDIFPTLNAIGEAVTQRTSLLEELDGHFSKKFLPQWTARSPRLHSLVLWEGNALGNGVEDAIRENCQSFRSLTIRQWLESDADETFATFVSGLRPNSLEYFEMISFSNIASLSFKALNQHSKSLTELTLGSLHDDAILALGRLKECTALRTLVLEDNVGALQLEATQNDIFLEIVEWLSACSSLRDLTLKKFYDGPAILAQVLSSPNVSLIKLSLEGYVVRRHGSAAFHTSLSEQPELQSVWLKGDGDEVLPNDLDIMVDALCRLPNLHELVLKDVSDEFEESHIIRLALELPLLEDFWTSGLDVSSDVLPCLARLKNLKNLTLYALTKFSSQEIIDFISELDAQTQRGFNLSLMASDTEHDLSEEEQNFIREILKTKLDGRFDFVLWREAEPSDIDSD